MKQIVLIVVLLLVTGIVRGEVGLEVSPEFTAATLRLHPYGENMSGVFVGLLGGEYNDGTYKSVILAIETGYRTHTYPYLEASIGGYQEVFETPVPDDQKTSSLYPLMGSVVLGWEFSNRVVVAGGLRYLSKSNKIYQHDVIGNRLMVVVQFGIQF